LGLPGTLGKLPLRRGRSKLARFADCVRDCVDDVSANCPAALAGIDVGFEDVPGQLPAWEDRVPLATSASGTPGHNGQLILFRRPIEHRCPTYEDLDLLVRRTIVEELSSVTGIPAYEIDPDYDPDL
jgi:hypothetical protein